MEALIKEKKVRSNKKNQVNWNDKTGNKTQQPKSVKLVVDYSQHYLSFNKQEDEDAAVRTDVWN